MFRSALHVIWSMARCNACLPCLIILQKPEKGIDMATNPPKGDGQRKGMVRDRSQTKTSSGNYVKRDTNTGRFMDVKSDKKPFKGVRKER